jgi:outer membrane protein TolC
MLFGIDCTAQESLSLKDAITIAIEHNYDVRSASLIASQAANNNTAGEAGLLPVVSVEGGFNRTDLNLNQKLSDGRVIERNAAASETINAAAQVSWTLFDGMGMFVRKNRLGSQQAESDIALRLQMETTIAQVINAYYGVLVQEQQLAALKELLKVDSIRERLAEIRMESGNGAKPDLLQARLDKNLHLSQQKEVQMLLANQQENLNVLLGRDPGINFTTTDPIQLNKLTADASTRPNDLQLKLADQQKQTAFQQLRESRSNLYPVLRFNASYVFNQTENEAGFLLRNQNDGPGFGLNLSWTLFDGLRTNRTIRNAKLNLQRFEIQQQRELLYRQQAERRMEREYALQLEIVKLEEERVAMANENLLIVTERLRTGLTNSLEIQDAQRNYQDATSRLYTARYNAKISETEILKLRGELLK